MDGYYSKVGGEGGCLAGGKLAREKSQNVKMKCNRMDVIGRADREERDCVTEIKDKKKINGTKYNRRGGPSIG